MNPDECASTFLPLELFDGGVMEPMPDALWEDAEALFVQGRPYCGRSKFYMHGEQNIIMIT